jgi:hypothetical protein
LRPVRGRNKRIVRQGCRGTDFGRSSLSFANDLSD